MRVSRGNHIGTGLVNLGMDHESRFIDGQLSTPFSHIALAVHEDKIRSFDGGEVLGKWIHPEVVLQDRV